MLNVVEKNVTLFGKMKLKLNELHNQFVNAVVNAPVIGWVDFYNFIINSYSDM